MIILIFLFKSTFKIPITLLQQNIKFNIKKTPLTYLKFNNNKKIRVTYLKLNLIQHNKKHEWLNPI